MPLTLRSEKGSALTYEEMDANFQGIANGAFLETTIVGTYEFDQVNATIGVSAPLIEGTTIEATTSVKTPTFLNAAGDNHFEASKVTNGYQKLPGGLIIQWATELAPSNTGGWIFVTFPIAFPNACLNISLTTVATSTNTGGIDRPHAIRQGQILNTGFQATINSGNPELQYIAIGH